MTTTKGVSLHAVKAMKDIYLISSDRFDYIYRVSTDEYYLIGAGPVDNYGVFSDSAENMVFDNAVERGDEFIEIAKSY